ncbi:MAG: hypothetical protein ACYDCX_08490 [Acidithiobacillus sp.]
MKKDQKIYGALRMTVVTVCLALSTTAHAEKVTEPVPSSAPLAPDLRAAMRSGHMTLDQILRAEDYINTAPGDFTKNGDVPEYDVTVAGLNHFKKLLKDFFNPALTDWDTQLKLPQGCRWIPNPPALSPIILPNASVSAPVHASQWRVISCAGKLDSVNTGGRTKSWTAFMRFYLSVTSASVTEATAIVRANLNRAGYKELHWKGYNGECTDDPQAMCLTFYNLKMHANVFPIISNDIVPPSFISHPEYITKYAPMISPLKDYLHKTGRITTIQLIEVSQTPLDTPATPLRGIDTAIDGIPGNPGAKR